MGADEISSTPTSSKLSHSLLEIFDPEKVRDRMGMAGLKSRGRSWFSYFKYNEDEETPKDARNVLLIVVGLIAAVTFQAGVNPPGGVWQDDGPGHEAGRAIYASSTNAYYVFLISNTLALSSSILVLVSLTYRFPFHLEILVATASMIITYGSAVFAVTPREHVHFRYVLLTAALPFVIRCCIQIYNKYRRDRESDDQ